ncbi:MAG: hypothetical protein WDN48_07375 [Pseudolabrys sp.]
MFLFERAFARGLERDIHALAFCDVEKAVDRTDHFAFALRSGSILTDTINCVPSGRTTMRSASRTGVPVTSTSESSDRFNGVPSSSQKREPWLNLSWVWPGAGVRPQISTARWLYCRIVPRASEMKVAIGSMSRMPSDARNIALKAGGIGWGAGRRVSARIRHAHASARDLRFPGTPPGPTMRARGYLSMVRRSRGLLGCSAGLRPIQ